MLSTRDNSADEEALQTNVQAMTSDFNYAQQMLSWILHHNDNSWAGKI
jgi:hypothetical protein